MRLFYFFIFYERLSYILPANAFYLFLRPFFTATNIKKSMIFRKLYFILFLTCSFDNPKGYYVRIRFDFYIYFEKFNYDDLLGVSNIRALILFDLNKMCVLCSKY